ncbi:MAG: EthD family reductase [Caulobacteraceae bacterium]
MRCITILYPSKDNEDFNFEFYKTRHAPLMKDILGDACDKIEVRRGTDVQFGVPPLYVATITLWISDWAKYEERMAKRSQEMIDEVPMFTKAMPQVQIDEVLLEI